jgi:hypothetical protein
MGKTGIFGLWHSPEPIEALKFATKGTHFQQVHHEQKKDTSLFAHLCRREFASPDFDFCSMRYSIESYDVTEEK